MTPEDILRWIGVLLGVVATGTSLWIVVMYAWYSLQDPTVLRHLAFVAAGTLLLVAGATIELTRSVGQEPTWRTYTYPVAFALLLWGLQYLVRHSTHLRRAKGE